MISLKNYVQRRNGVPLGHPNSLMNMLKRSFGANSFDMFWVHWNPIWNYYLNKHIYKSLKSISHRYLAIILTFCVSGFIHDLVGLLIYKKLAFFFSIWFFIMGVIVVISKHKKIQYSKHSITTISLINLSIILGSLYLARFLYI
jgi:hypothetical protein